MKFNEHLTVCLSMKMYTKDSISNHCMYDYFEKGFVYIVGVKQQPHAHSILASWNSVHLYTDGYDMINKVREIQAIGGDNPDCPELTAAGMLAGIRI